MSGKNRNRRKDYGGENRGWCCRPIELPRHGRLARSCAPRENWKALGHAACAFAVILNGRLKLVCRFRRTFVLLPPSFHFLERNEQRSRPPAVSTYSVVTSYQAAVRIVEFYPRSRFHPRGNQFKTPLLLHNASRSAMISPEHPGVRFIHKQTERHNFYRDSDLPHSFILPYQFVNIGYNFLFFSLALVIFHVIDCFMNSYWRSTALPCAYIIIGVHVWMGVYLINWKSRT